MAAHLGLESHRDVPLFQARSAAHAPTEVGSHRQSGRGGRASHSRVRPDVRVLCGESGNRRVPKSLAREVGPFGITVNVVAPGVIDDPELPIADAGRTKDKRLAVPRVGTGEDVANAVLFLVCEEAEFVTGDVLGVTGG